MKEDKIDQEMARRVRSLLERGAVGLPRAFHRAQPARQTKGAPLLKGPFSISFSVLFPNP
jgi:hypothetical protein